MKTLPAALSVLLLTPALWAQQPQGAQQPQPAQQGADPEVVREPTPEERLAKVQADIAKLEKELGQIKKVESAGGMPARVKAFLKERQLAVTQITGYVAPMSKPQKTGARLLGDAEKQKLPVDVIFTVDGVPVRKAEFVAAYEYLKSYPREDNDAALKTQAVLELVRIKAAQAASEVTAQQAKKKIMEAQQELRAGKDFAEVAKAMSQGPSAPRGGDLGTFGHGERDFAITMTAFGLKPGQVSNIVESQIGYHIIRVTGESKGETPAQNRVSASHILASYTNDQARQAEVRMRVNSGKVDLAFVADEYRAFTPDIFKNK